MYSATVLEARNPKGGSQQVVLSPDAPGEGLSCLFQLPVGPGTLCLVVPPQRSLCLHKTFSSVSSLLCLLRTLAVGFKGRSLYSETGYEDIDTSLLRWSFSSPHMVEKYRVLCGKQSVRGRGWGQEDQ